MRVYPRACGGTMRSCQWRLLFQGLSPRVRGNHQYNAETERIQGSIPARAGEPIPAPIMPLADRVYPRACGGTFNQVPEGALVPGLSPRVRGNRHRQRRYGGCPGSIPARAGEPTPRASQRCTDRVYPRACGGTKTLLDALTDTPGLSPRVRGNLRQHQHHRGDHGSIPARAGEPRLGHGRRY